MLARSLALSGALLGGLLAAEPAAAAPELSISPSSIVFASTCVGRSSATVTVKASNTGDRSLRIENVFVTGANAEEFPIPQDPALPADLDPGAVLSFGVAFAPRATGQRSGRLVVESDAGRVGIEMSGAGADRRISLGTRTVSFGGQRVGERSPGRTISITNNGAEPLALKPPVLVGPAAGDFSVSSPRSATLSPGGSTTLSISFRPRSAGTRTATLTVVSNACNAPALTVGLSGSGVAPELRLDPEVVDVGAVLPGSTGGRTQISLANEGSAALVVTAVQIVGSNPGDFTLEAVPALPQTIAAGEALLITAVFTPSAAGIRTATLRVSSDDPKRPAAEATLRGFGGVDETASPTPSPATTPSGSPSPGSSRRPAASAAAAGSPRPPPADALAVLVVVLAVGGAFGGLVAIGRRRREVS